MKKILDYLSIIGVLYILAYQVDIIRVICKRICVYMQNWFLLLNNQDIVSIYLIGEKIFQGIILLDIVVGLISWISRLYKEKKSHEAQGSSRFERSLFKYIHDDTIPRCFLITGQWGSGKSYEVNQFFNKYYSSAITKVYRISCFGLDSRKELIEEINNTISHQDTSYYSKIVRVIQLIPVIGESLNKLLKKEYGYQNIKKGSIFIFDDFERVTSRGIDSNYQPPLYKRSVEMSKRRSYQKNNSLDRELNDVKKEFENVEKAFNGIQNSISLHSTKMDYEKYISLIGFINELIEVYGMKVIIVCNDSVKGTRFVHDILRSKLNCTEYKKVVTIDAKKSIVNDLMSNIVIHDENKQTAIHQYLELLKKEIDNLELDNIFNDLRLFGGLIQAFIDTAIAFDADKLTNNFLNSLLNSIMIAQSGYYNNSNNSINEYINGANIVFLKSLFGGTFNKKHLIRLNSIEEEPTWVDIRVSQYWIYNLVIPDDINEIYIEWKNYPYGYVEKLLINNRSSHIDNQDIDFIHVLFYVRRNQQEETMLYTELIRHSLKNYNLESREIVEELLELYIKICGETSYSVFQQAFFEELAKYNRYGRLCRQSLVYDAYNNYLDHRQSN